MSVDETDLIEDIMLFVRLSACERHPWMDELRMPSETEERIERLIIQRYPSIDQVVDETPTKVLL